jgi:hypothetical protein
LGAYSHGAHVPGVKAREQTSGSDLVCDEYVDGDYYDHYEEYPEYPGPGVLPENLIDGGATAQTERGSMSPDSRSCSRAERPLAPAVAVCEDDGYDGYDSNLIEMFIGILSQPLIEGGITEEDYIKASPYLTDGGCTTTQTERQRLFAPAVTLFGERWQSALARAAGYSQGHLQQVFTGIRALTVDVEQAVLGAYRQEIVRAEERAARARAGIIRILEAKG